ncbi:DNA phosphorothioation-associated putative methyltransferase [Phormidium sp. LEGE 05292]|uniref:DNA phosphorothioation-associated putative methyltransferase n=1 Tax=[Phormidium] sp. LEGE 05292 TaxID=767427 RepID=UPI00187F0950|nr:DNA phosphorothioation-associated putative methyltransferase [Phormidium sp. LEGE 05292]MBE9224420.1 DNA phosphorothioation-associated putative methyltransferase [Phormidium sp. LEGE 05292]
MTSFSISDELLFRLEEPGAIETCCLQSAIGKKLPNALYVHISAIEKLDPLLRLHYDRFLLIVGTQIDQANIVKFHTNESKISFLYYPEFDTDPHPALHTSIQVDLKDNSINYRNYFTADNPPILHRKETFVTAEYPNYAEFAELTRQEQILGLLDKTNFIGTLKGWQQCLDEKGVEIRNHRLFIITEYGEELEFSDLNFSKNFNHPSPVTFPPQIQRHRAAMMRRDISRPVRLALEANIFNQDTTFFDYGCGYGGDVKRIAENGFISNGWDPYYFPDNPIIPADIVNIGYVINVIECQKERREALLKAWELTKQVLVVSAQVLIDDERRGQVAYSDGFITRKNTFQKYYQQEELKVYIDQVLEVDSIPIALGIYFVFRDPTQAEAFRASRCRSRLSTPRVKYIDKRFEDYQELLQPLMAFVTERGRLPLPGEFPQETELKAEFGRISRAFQVILQATDRQEWDMITEKRYSDLLLYLALQNFNEPHKLKDIPPVIQRDIKGLFGSYRKAKETAEGMLFSIGNLSIIAKCCEASNIGSKRAHALYVHVSALPEIDYRLRIYEGCASRTLGRMDGATLIKFHTKIPKISYLFYPNFDTDPHPALHTSMHIDLRDLHVSYRDYADSNDPPLWHRKETVLTPDYPDYEKFVKLSQQEENWGLFDDLNSIRTLKSWQRCLEEHCAEIRNYRLYWQKDADPYRLKLAQAAKEARYRKTRGKDKV